MCILIGAFWEQRFCDHRLSIVGIDVRSIIVTDSPGCAFIEYELFMELAVAIFGRFGLVS